jgi:hypothetical protein
VVALVATVCSLLAAGEGPVTKLAESFDAAPWALGAWNKAAGKTALSADVPPGVKSEKSLEIETVFSGQGFEWFGVSPASPLVVPGDMKSVTLRAKVSDTRFPLALKFKDGWGRVEVGKTKLEYGIPFKDKDTWITATFTVPADWVRPLTIDGFSTHNWNAQNDKNTVRFWVDQLEITTDTSGVDAETGVLKSWKPNADENDPKKKVTEAPRTPLINAEFTTPVPSNVFSRQAPSVTLSLRNWTVGALTGKALCTVEDAAGQKVFAHEQPVSADSAASYALPLKTERFGLYTLRATLELEGRKPLTRKMTFAHLPPYPELTDAQKQASPYGMNVHGGKETLRIEPFRNAGMVWFRDYAFNFEWMVRAKGADKRYGGWPWYPALVKRYADAGVKVLPCLMGSIKAPEVKDGKVTGPIGPDRAWGLEIADILSAFPQMTHWELSNEYDLDKKHAEAESLIEWRNYRVHHKRFAEIVSALGAGEVVAVENGRAGIWPERLRACVSSGDFANVGVANVHHYCGVEAPEANYGNFNTGFEGTSADEDPALFYDRLRAAKRAATSDGKARECWLTEFGWDTLAGNVVTPYEQAVFLARGYMLTLAAGMDKSFWFFDYDSPTPHQFFDGCGLLAADASPKLSLCAMAGLTSVLPRPKYVGDINAGEDTAGYVFENDGKLVAALWTITRDKGPEVSFAGAQLYDYLGNKLPGTTATLTRAPVYAVGIDKNDAWFKQTAYSLDTPYLVVATAGDPVTPVLRLRNNRGAAIQAQVKLALPDGWKAEKPDAPLAAAPGEQQTVALPFTVPVQESLGQREVRFAIAEGGAVKEIRLQVLVRPPLIMQVGPIKGRPGQTEVAVKVGNKSAQPVNGALRLELPAAWKAAAAEIKVEQLKSQEIRDVTCAFEWNTNWKPDERAEAVFATPDGKSVRRPLIPNAWKLRKAPALKMDGKLDDWPAAAQLPAWMLGASLGEPQAKVFLAWGKEGLYCGVEVQDSVINTADPRSFWNGDCLELFVDTADDKRHRFFEPGDHQFWFVPQANGNRVYAGQWKRKDEIADTKYDLPGVQSAAVRTADGYTLEFLLPAALLQKFKPEAGGKLGLSVNLTVKGKRFAREVYWPWTKSDWSVQNLPKSWGSVELAD